MKNIPFFSYFQEIFMNIFLIFVIFLSFFSDLSKIIVPTLYFYLRPQTLK